MKNIKKLFYYPILVIMICGCGQDNKPIFDVPIETIEFYSFKMHKDEYIPDESIREKTYIKLDASTGDALFKSIDKIKISFPK